MNVALPALVVFLVLLPGFILRSQFKRAERTSLDYSPFGQVVAEAVLWALSIHIIWLTLSYGIFGRYVDAAVFLKLLSSDAPSQVKATEAVALQANWITAYFVTLLLGSYLLPKGARYIITKYRLDRINSRASASLRFHQAPWYYLLTGADFEKDNEPDFISISAIVNVAGEPFLYNGVLDEFFVDSEGNLDRLVLEQVMRRPMAADKATDSKDAGIAAPRFYQVDGDYFVLRYSEAITLNIQYIKLEEVDDTGMDDGSSPDSSEAMASP